jgi:excisionase family DNA binding protein
MARFQPRAMLTASLDRCILRLYGHSVHTPAGCRGAMNRISISEAAREFGVSRRTLERWVRRGRLTTVPDVGDGRQRLVDPEMVKRLVNQMPRRRADRQRHVICGEKLLENDGRPGAIEVSDEERYHEAIDAALLKVYRHDRRLLDLVDPGGVRELTLEELREGPLGRDLRLLADYAQRHVYADRRLVPLAVDSVLQVLFWPVAADDYVVPRSFWDTDLGQMLGRAKLHSYRPDELVSVDEAVRLLGVTAPTLYRWMDDRTLGYVRDDANGRTRIVRRDIDRLKRKVAELLGRQPEHALAS